LDKPELASELLPLVHRVVSLLKRWLMNTHQGAVSHEHLDYYLDEFTFRFNRRKKPQPEKRLRQEKSRTIKFYLCDGKKTILSASLSKAKLNLIFFSMGKNSFPSSSQESHISKSSLTSLVSLAKTYCKSATVIIWFCSMFLGLIFLPPVCHHQFG
jgi:hypothetical protein